MPVRTERPQELQTLNVEKLSTNLFGNLVVPAFKEKYSAIQKAQSYDKVNDVSRQTIIEETRLTDNSLVSAKSVTNISSNGSNGQSLKKHWFVQQKGLNRYDSGYESNLDFNSDSNGTTPVLEELNEINVLNESEHYLISQWQSSPDVLHSLQGKSSSAYQSSSTSSISPTFSQSPVATPPPPPEKKRNEYIRKVERFGSDLKDTCLFPLALPMDGSDVYKGASTWESISLLADCVLYKWEESAKKNRKVVNKALTDATKYLCPHAELEASLMQRSNLCLPLRRVKSELDLCKFGFHERSDFLEKGSKAKTIQRKAAAKDDIDINVSVDKGRNRSMSSLSVRKNSVQFSVRKERKDKFDLKVDRNLKSEAKALVKSIRIENPISLALQITKIEKDLILSISVEEMMSNVLNRGKSVAKISRIKKALEFGQELSQLVADIIVREATNEAQGKKIAAIIEVACVLRKLRNWQSLSSLIRGLQLPRIYRLSSAWTITRTKYPVHFNDYLKLSQVVRFSEIGILRSRQPCIPSILSLVSLLRVRCSATWDKLEIQPRWLESPSLVHWLEGQMLNAIINDLHPNGKTKQKKLKQIKQHIENFHGSDDKPAETHLAKCIKELCPERASFMPLNDPIYFIEDDHLPTSWTQRSVKNIPSLYQSKIIRCFKNSYKIEMTHIEKFNINS